MFSSTIKASSLAQRPSSSLQLSIQDGKRRALTRTRAISLCMLAIVALAVSNILVSSYNSGRVPWYPAEALDNNAHDRFGHRRRAKVAKSTALKKGRAHSWDYHSNTRTRQPNLRTLVGEPEIWARGPSNTSNAGVALRKALGAGTARELRALCGRCLYRTLTSYVQAHDHGRFTVVLTGDIAAMWLRDSAVQMATYIPRVAGRPALRQLLEGAIRAQAYFILQVSSWCDILDGQDGWFEARRSQHHTHARSPKDPWANAYNARYIVPQSLPKYDRQLGRGGWVFTRNFELDSVAYFFNFLWNFHQSPDVWSPGTLLNEPLIHDAIVTMLRLLVVEQRHEDQSPYRYSELPREGLGPPTAYTGMVWSAFRPSDDPQKYSYNLPDNMYLWGALKRLVALNDALWRDPVIYDTAVQLMDDVHHGIEDAIVEVEPGIRVYAYEVDGLGGVLTDFDDPNLPSLLATPLLGYDLYDKDVYAATRARILSHKNSYFYEGSELRGLGSPHTQRDFIWPLATAVEALTVEEGGGTTRQVKLLQDLLKMASGNGLAHESVNVNNLNLSTRPEFGWANAMMVVVVEQLLGIDCNEAAEEYRLLQVAAREERERRAAPNGGPDLASYYEQLEASVVHK